MPRTWLEQAACGTHGVRVGAPCWGFCRFALENMKKLVFAFLVSFGPFCIIVGFITLGLLEFLGIFVLWGAS